MGKQTAHSLLFYGSVQELAKMEFEAFVLNPATLLVVVLVVGGLVLLGWAWRRR
jgi:hypothetical protein